MLRRLSMAGLLLASTLSAPAQTGSAPAQAGSALVQAADSKVAAICIGGDARVEGSGNTVRLTGACRSLAVFGDGNAIAVELVSAASVHIEGSRNVVTYALRPGAEPPVPSLFGTEDVLSQLAVAAAPGATALLDLTGDDQQRDLDCAGRPVRISGARNRIVLHGGCRSVSVTGAVNLIEAEMQPHGTIEVDGRGTVVAYTGSPVTVRVHGGEAMRVGLRAAP